MGTKMDWIVLVFYGQSLCPAISGNLADYAQ